MLRLKPFLLVAVWEDGTFVCRGDFMKPMGGAGSLSAWAESKLTCGSMVSSDVVALQEAVAKAGFFRPPLGDGIRFIDGPSQSLCIRYGKARRLLSHQGYSDKWLHDHISSLGPQSRPRRKDAEDFVAMWDIVMQLISKNISRVKTSDFRDELKLEPPKPFDATDAKGDPCINYWNEPEYKETVEHAGTPRSLVTMTTVRTVDRKNYEEIKAGGSVTKEERHGDWLYFSIDGIAQIPNDTASMGVVYRYKTCMPLGSHKNLTKPVSEKGKTRKP